MSKTFYRIYRPQRFDELLGQDLIRRTLSQSVKENRITHAYLFTGPRGTGKTTTARIFAKAVNCLTPIEKRPKGEPCDKCDNCLAILSGKTLDLMEIDAASYTGVDNIRQLTENIDLAPANLKYRVFIIDEVHMLSRGAFNALLKTLEEPPAHTIFILATTEQHKVPQTITSRCQRFSFRLLTLPEITKKLETVASKEKIDIDKESLGMIGEAAHGGMRDAESLFSQLVSLAGKKITSKETIKILGITGRNDLLKLLDSLFDKNLSNTIEIFERINNEGMDMFLLSHKLLDSLRKIVYLKLNPRGAKIIKEEISESQLNKLENLAKKITLAEVLDLTSKIVQSQPNIKTSSFPHLPLELAIIDWRLKDNLDLNTYDKKISDDQTESPETDSESNKIIESEDKAEENNEKTSPNPSEKKTKSAPKADLKEEKATDKKTVSADLKTVLDKWTAVLQNVRELQPALFSLLKVCSPVKIEDDALVISTPFKFHKDKLSDGKNRAIFCQELNKEVGIGRICVVQDDSLPKNKVDDEELLNQVKDLLG